MSRPRDAPLACAATNPYLPPMAAQRIVLAYEHSQPFACAGWAYVVAGDPASGAAGGRRRVGAWTGAAAALSAVLQAGGGLVLTAHPRIAGLIAAVRAGAPPEGLEPADLAAFDQLLKLAAGQPLGFQPTRAAPGGAAAFCAAWAELARDRAKAKGDFTAPIPKPNLARLAPF